jgi:hypothetical protein
MEAVIASLTGEEFRRIAQVGRHRRFWNRFNALPGMSKNYRSRTIIFAEARTTLLSRSLAERLALCLDNDITGSKITWSVARKTRPRCGQIAAFSLDRRDTPSGDYLWRMKSKIGPQAAPVATAHKIAASSTNSSRTRWKTTGPSGCNGTRKTKTAKVKRQAPPLGFELTLIVQPPPNRVYNLTQRPG